MNKYHHGDNCSDNYHVDGRYDDHDANCGHDLENVCRWKWGFERQTHLSIIPPLFKHSLIIISITIIIITIMIIMTMIIMNGWSRPTPITKA